MSRNRQGELFGQGAGGAAATSLDPQQTSEQVQHGHSDDDELSWSDRKRMDALERFYAAQCIKAEPEELAFRHRGWSRDRDRVRVALRVAGFSEQRLERFEQCGAACRVELASDGSGARLKAQYCGDRWCVPCCRGRAVHVVAELRRLAEGQPVRLATFTARPAGETLAECLQHVYASFKRLRATAEWKRRVRAGAVVCEITRGAAGRHWHVHLHCLLAGSFFAHGRLRELWTVASRGSHVVDIRLIRDDGDAVEYVAKYATKGWSASVLRSADHTAEAMRALTGRRLIATFGEWYNADLEAEPADAREWVSAGSFVRIARQAAGGCEWATSVMMLLRVVVTPGEQGVSFGELVRP